MKLSHYSAVPIKHVDSVAQVEGPDVKPQGLWVSVDGPEDWPDWCKRAQFKEDTLRHRYRVTLQMSRILVLSTPQELDNFTTGFVSAHAAELALFMNWGLVAEQYAGIIVAPYIWSRRLHLLWYYGWDCAGGCVWDAAAVRSLKLLKR